MKKYYFFFFFVLGYALLPSFVAGQAIGLRHYDVDEGIPQSDVYQLEQDENGFLWIATGNGLARFDGHEMQTFSERNGLLDNFITTIETDSINGGIWIGHPRGLISYYNFKTDSIEKITSPQFALLSRVQQFLIEKDMVWALTEREGVFRITIDKQGNKQLLHYPLENNFDKCNVFEKIGSSDFLVGTNKGLRNAVIQGKNFFLQNAPSSLDSIPIYAITKRKGNQTGFWIGTQGKGIYEYFSANDIRRAFSADTLKALSQSFSDKTVNVILEDKRGKLWIGTTEKGIYRIEATKRKERIIDFTHYTTKNGLPSNEITSILQDYEGSVWIGTANDGLIQMMHEMFEIYTAEHGLPNANILSLLRTKDNEIILGTEKGISLFRHNNDSIYVDTFIPNFNYAVRSIFQDSTGRLWLGTHEKGLFWYEPQTKKITSIRQVPDNTINKIISDDEGSIWIATNSWGLFRYTPDNNRFTQILPSKTININRVQNIYKDRQNQIWIASPDYTLLYWKAEKFTVLDAVEEFSQVKATCFAEDAENHLWIGTEGAGVFSYADQQIKKYTTANGLASNYSYFIAADRNYNIWIGSRKGITRLRAQDDLAKVYHHTDGFVGTEANRDAVLQDINGDLWFGTTNGLIRYIGQNDHINFIRPKVILSGLRIFGEERVLEPNLKLPYDDYSLRFDFRTITFRYPNKVKFKYRLIGFNEEWSEPTTQNFAYYSHLSDGKYIFEVLATNDDGIWATQPAVYTFQVTTPIWKETWFLVLLTLLLFLGMFGYVRWRTYAIDKRRKYLEKEVENQTQKIRLKNEELEQTNELLKESEKELSDSNMVKDRMFSIISHDLRSPLATLQNFLKMFMTYKDAFSEDEINRITRDINRSLGSVGDLLENLLQWSRSQMGHLETKSEPLVLVDYIQKNIELLLPTAKNKDINLQVASMNENNIVLGDPNLLNFILRNLISNAIKFTKEGGIVTISAIETNRKMIAISVKDNGVGMSEEIASQLFQTDKVISTRGTANEKGTGLGLMVCKEFTEKQGGTIHVQSKEEEGTTFTFTLPKGILED